MRLQMLRAMFGEHYDIHVLRCDPSDVGHAGASRERVYVILAHNSRTRMITCPKELYNKIAGVISKHIATRPRDYFVASHLDVRLAEEDLALSRKRKVRVPCL